MKRILAYLLVCSCLLVSILPLSGCGIKEKAEKAVTEKIVEKALGDNVDIDGDTVTIKGEDGEKVSFGGGQWPDSDLAKKIPKFTKGAIVTSVTEDNSIMVFLEKVEAGDFDAYLEEIEKAYSQDAYESRTDEMVTFGGNDGDQTTVSINFISKEGTMGITVTKMDH
ncbi:MAG: DUF6591 domain-containing protein [Clostridiaceae bacterium]|jgi:hypothetical protein|nr:DUF6591 domain-containing protein [Clostridiaceae bacterium]